MGDSINPPISNEEALKLCKEPPGETKVKNLFLAVPEIILLLIGLYHATNNV